MVRARARRRCQPGRPLLGVLRELVGPNERRKGRSRVDRGAHGIVRRRDAGEAACLRRCSGHPALPGVPERPPPVDPPPPPPLTTPPACPPAPPSPACDDIMSLPAAPPAPGPPPKGSWPVAASMIPQPAEVATNSAQTDHVCLGRIGTPHVSRSSAVRRVTAQATRKLSREPSARGHVQIAAPRCGIDLSRVFGPMAVSLVAARSPSW